MRRFLFSLSLLLLSFCFANGEDLYLDPKEGVDMLPCLINLPCKTVGFVLSIIQHRPPSDTVDRVLMGPGTYAESQLMLFNRSVIIIGTPNPSAPAWFDCVPQSTMPLEGPVLTFSGKNSPVPVSVTVLNAGFRHCYAPYGAAISAEYVTLTVTNARFEDLTADVSGGVHSRCLVLFDLFSPQTIDIGVFQNYRSHFRRVAGCRLAAFLQHVPVVSGKAADRRRSVASRSRQDLSLQHLGAGQLLRVVQSPIRQRVLVFSVRGSV